MRTALFRPFSASVLWYADGTEEGVTGMVVYWDLAALVNGAADYLLLLSAARLAGRTVPRLRLLGAAAFGAAYAVLRFVLPCSPWLTAAAFVGMALLAFRGTGRAFKLGLLTLLLSCALGGGVLLLGQCCGSLGRIARGVIFAQLPWGVLLGAMGVTYLLLSTVFRGGARHDGGRQRDAAGVLLRQRSRERQGLGTAAGRRFAGHLRR